MATESPVRVVQSIGARKCHPSKDGAIFGLPLRNMAAEELGFLLQGHTLHGDQIDILPSRRGSAPPSTEGSFADVLAQQNFNLGSDLESINSAVENCESEEQLLSDPAYFAYYCSNINMNPRLPPPLISRENQRLVCHMGRFGNNWRPSLNDSVSGSLKPSCHLLSTHKGELEDDILPREASENCSESSSVYVSGKNIEALGGRHKSLVDLIQEDFPRTPSPVYSQSCSSSHAAEEAIDHNTRAISLDVPPINISKVPEIDSGSDVCADTDALETDAISLIPNDDTTTSLFPALPCCDGTLTQQKCESSAKITGFDGHGSSRYSCQAGIPKMESRMRKKPEEQQSCGQNMPQSKTSLQQGFLPQAEVISRAMVQSHCGMKNSSCSHPNLSATNARPSFHSPALNRPLYASAAAYMTSGAAFYPSFQPSAFCSSLYGVGGYPLDSAFLPPLMTRCASQRAIPVPFDVSSGPTIDGQTAAALAGESILHSGSLQHLGKLYGQHGSMLQPSIMDPLHIQYLHHTFGDGYGAAVPQNCFQSPDPMGSQIDSFVSQMEPTMAAYMGDLRFQAPINGSPGIPSLGKLGITGGSYYRAPTNMSVITQFPASPRTSPLLPTSPVGGINHLGHRPDMRFPQGSIRNGGFYSADQGQRGVDGIGNSKQHYFLKELKTSNAQKFELSDMAGHIVESSVDQHGSRFIQQKLEHCSVEERETIFKEVLPHASKLMTDVFGNYVIQKFFEYGCPEQRKELADKLAGHMLPLSLQMYGCRVIQKALEVMELDQKSKLVQELDGHVVRCVRDQNGNHVIQKCIECVPAHNIGFIISAFQGQVVTLSTHPYGCRVIQRVLEHCSGELQSQCVVDEILESAYFLAQDQYGNYVTQHLLERGKPSERRQIITTLTGKIVQMSQHKYASNVIEKCLEHADSAERDLLIEEIIGHSEENDNLVAMMKDQFANYVVQKILETSNDKQQEILFDRIRVHLHALRKYTYGKHTVARFEQLCGTENQGSET